MKKLIIVAIAIVASMGTMAAWGRHGHEVVIAVAQRHLTEKTKKNIEKFIDYDLKKDAVWMDIHRNDKPIDYSDGWHSFYYDKDFKYNPNITRKMAKGDVFRALTLVDATFHDKGYERHCDSIVVFHLRSLIHFVGDMHCPVHTHTDGFSSKYGKCKLNGKTYKSFHTVYDAIPKLIWGSELTADQIAEKLDNAKRKEIKKIVSGTIYDWMTGIARMNRVVYDWHAGEPTVLREDTVELSTELINTQLRNAGYRLAYLLNLYFGE